MPQETAMSWKDLLDTTQSAVTIVGILFGGAWSYMRFVRGRILKPHVTLRISGSLHSMRERHYLVATVSVANKGNIVVDVDHQETSIAVFAEAYRRGGFYWNDIDALHVLGDTDLVEPDEDVEAEYLIPFPCTPQVALRLEFRLKARARLFGIGRVSRWDTSHIIVPDSIEKSRRSENGAPDGA